MTNAATCLALAERVEGLTGADAAVDEAIMALLFDREERNIGTQEEQDDGSWAPVKTAVWVSRETGKWVGTHARNFTGPLDAVRTLAPDMGWTFGCYKDPVTDQPYNEARVHFERATGATPELAFLAAALRALAARQEQGA